MLQALSVKSNLTYRALEDLSSQVKEPGDISEEMEK